MAADYRRDRLAGTLPTPVFIVCQNRTGSTFLNRLFGEHPECWTYREGSHQEAMRQEDCPRWLSGQPFLERWRIRDCSWVQRWQTPRWLAAMAGPHPFGVFKIPHALTKVAAISRIVPQARFVLLVRHPAAQVASALAKNNRVEQLKVTADVLIRFLSEERKGINHLSILRYEDLLASPAATFGGLCASLGMNAAPTVIERCIERIGVQPGRGPDWTRVPAEMLQRVRKLCALLDYDPEAVE